MKDATELLRLPKIELHEHLDGSLRIATILELAQRDGVELPTTDPKALVAILSPGPSSLEEYLKAFAITTSVMQSASALRRVAFEMVEDWFHDGVVYGEVRFAPELHTRRGLAMEQVVEEVLLGLDDGRTRYPVETGLILCSMRNAPPTLETAQLVDRYRDQGVVGFDLAGAEAPFPASLHREAFEFCAARSLAVTCHAGEVTGPDSIRQALVDCRSLRIGHGTQLIQEWGPSQELPGPRSLTRWILDRGIPLELCLTSNLQTKATPDIASHPFETFRRNGIKVTLNTDNRLVSSTSLSAELFLAQTTWNLSEQDLLDLQLNSLSVAFCSHETRERIRAKHFSTNADTQTV